MKTLFTQRYLLAAALTLLVCASAQAGKKIRVYFIGNSYIYTNDMPQVISGIATAMGDTLVYQQHTVGGFTLEDHWTDPGDPCKGQIAAGNWDYIVLQEQSQRPAFPYPQFLITYDNAANLVHYADTTSCANSMFFMSWGYKNGDPSNCPLPNYNVFCTYESMDSTIRARYMMMADSFHADVSPVGAVRHYIRHNYPGIELYQPDGSHPTEAGTYAGAVCFYTALFRRDPANITYNYTLNNTDAANIRTAARTVVYDSMSKWHLGVHDLSASFTYTQTGNQISFTNTTGSLKKSSYKWDFGDGNTSLLTSPNHTYASTGTYTVKLTVFDTSGNCSNTVNNTVNVFPAGVATINSKEEFILSPNPVSNTLVIQSPAFLKQHCVMQVYTSTGQLVSTIMSSQQERQQLDMTTLPAGVYFIRIAGEVTLWQGKVIRQ